MRNNVARITFRNGSTFEVDIKVNYFVLSLEGDIVCSFLEGTFTIECFLYIVIGLKRNVFNKFPYTEQILHVFSCDKAV